MQIQQRLYKRSQKAINTSGPYRVYANKTWEGALVKVDKFHSQKWLDLLSNSLQGMHGIYCHVDVLLIRTTKQYFASYFEDIDFLVCGHQVQLHSVLLIICTHQLESCNKKKIGLITKQRWYQLKNSLVVKRCSPIKND